MAAARVRSTTTEGLSNEELDVLIEALADEIIGWRHGLALRLEELDAARRERYARMRRPARSPFALAGRQAEPGAFNRAGGVAGGWWPEGIGRA